MKKFGKQAARAVNHDLINGSKYFTMMLETFVSDQAKKKAEKISSEIEMTEETNMIETNMTETNMTDMANMIE